MKKEIMRLVTLCISGLMCLGVSGCSKDEEPVEEKKEVYLGDVSQMEVNPVEFPEETDQKEIQAILKDINDDAYKIFKDKNYEELTDEDYKEFSKKYFLDNDELYLSKKYVALVHNVVDGYDGTLDEKYTTWKSLTLEGRVKTSAYMPTQEVTRLRTDVDLANIQTVSLSDITDENAGYVAMGKYQDILVGNGLLNTEWLLDVKESLQTNYPDIKYANMYMGTFRFLFEEKYPENELEITKDKYPENTTLKDLDSYIALPSNILDFILVKTTNGWKMMECKYLYSSNNVVND